ncbi:fibronectin type III domain-containing protein [Xanthomonas rydalmerensis]|uniref:Fibronectin type-III domain-containing protein n=1 Tax=Xanthomonas rydalmerensis TaxID=3046274 RepID=A0ABZ0JLM1_9XANT|nr:hypothetical protein [Xanthomonas sp. DM-2023]WOS40682.1 hypothetical protein QN243_20190 [Xanthomonas sp. DM-2023]WOS44866.1 hypothetical protein QN242_20190 [Xanthomonas sp. DM-2023]WOS49046.1 hypothetical protein QN240_20190 [Xanthomonas sp. DM-2023]WOS53226.1 hypothetical protein QN244_20195 [Xanthomonas sp. DM-2023]WOS57409.1 hypothetical protein QN245_20190 [Xanthomonas sp. DM-2023]
MAKIDIMQTNFTAGEISPRLKGRQDIARYQNGADIIENGIPVVHGGVDRRAGSRYCAPAKLNEDKGTILIGYIFNVDQSFMLEFGHQYVRFYTNTGAVILNAGLTPLELVSPYSRDQLAEITYTQKADTMLLFHPNVPTQRLRRLNATQWSIGPVPWVSEPFAENGHLPDSTLTISDVSPGAGRSFAAGAGTPPGAPTIGSATPLNAAANVSFSPPGSSGGAPVSSYTATSNPGGITGTGSASPVRVGGLTNGVSYTFTVTASNAFGTSPASAPTGAVTPNASLPGSQISVTAAPLDDFNSFPNGTRTGVPGPTATASGGIAPYSYLWAPIAGTTRISLDVANQAQMIYRSTGTNTENFRSFRCTATDASGATGTVDVNIYTSHGTPP